MSSRALRKALKQRELQEAQAKLAPLGLGPAKPAATTTSNVGQGGKVEVGGEEGEGEEEEEEEEEESDEAPPILRPNLFAMLGADDEDNVEEEDGDEDEDELRKPTSTIPKPISTPKPNKKKKSKKSRKKMNADSSSSSTRPAPRAVEDEIDKALRLLKLTPPVITPSNTSLLDGLDQDFLTLLKFDPRNFDASQEMRRLFGRLAVNHNAADDAGGGGVATPRGRRGARTSIGAGVQGRGTLRRNIFAQPKPNWPNAGSSGLAMVPAKDDECEFKFVHGTRYQDTQRQFMMCVLAMGTSAPTP